MHDVSVPPVDELTTWIRRAGQGDRIAWNAMFEALYPQLRRIAHARLAPHVRDGQLDTTALVHECWLRLVEGGRLSVQDRAHFLNFVGSAMRSIIVDAARARGAQRRGGDAVHVTLDTGIHDAVAADETGLVDIDEALARMAALDPRLVQVVEMRFFAGMSDLEIAQAMGVTDRTVRRTWDKARRVLAALLAP
jgi:RNA polymerase sigma factor (TIGR02999 family)